MLNVASRFSTPPLATLGVAVDGRTTASLTIRQPDNKASKFSYGFWGVSVSVYEPAAAVKNQANQAVQLLSPLLAHANSNIHHKMKVMIMVTAYIGVWTCRNSCSSWTTIMHVYMINLVLAVGTQTVSVLFVAHQGQKLAHDLVLAHSCFLHGPFIFLSISHFSDFSTQLAKFFAQTFSNLHLEFGRPTDGLNWNPKNRNVL